MEKIATKDDLFNVMLTGYDIEALKFALEPLLRRGDTMQLRRIVRKVKRCSVSIIKYK